MSHYARFHDQAWPKPNGELSWRLRYHYAEKAEHSTQERTDMYLAAEITAAYRELIEMPERQRRVVVRELRRAMEETSQ